MAGMLALASGAVAMAVLKGGSLHRKAGRIFVGAMWFMSAIGAGMAAVSDKRGTVVTVLAGLLTFYLVSTALLTMRRPVQEAREWITGFMMMGLSVGVSAFGLGLAALSGVGGRLDGLPPALYFVFGFVALSAALLDARMLAVGSIDGVHRLARHIWRMEFAMFIATASFFLGQAKQFPEPIRKSGLLAIPVLMVVLHLAYWLVRVLIKRRNLATAARSNTRE
ncbi:MAG: hypothetical protein A3E01_07615 [Gammaproteobacteria bacterium RIFCSPHIGHO2_12_FULL_63_22]|nr:MAG: hypothetical protein A3E01_07615 [Gammaproteobacteria bacterium RIFCSPHIGHO2_12_FULL_63_22]